MRSPRTPLLLAPAQMLAALHLPFSATVCAPALGPCKDAGSPATAFLNRALLARLCCPPRKRLAALPPPPLTLLHQRHQQHRRRRHRRCRRGRSYDVRLQRRGRRLYLHVMWKHLEQQSFPLTEEEYQAQLDAGDAPGVWQFCLGAGAAGGSFFRCDESLLCPVGKRLAPLHSWAPGHMAAGGFGRRGVGALCEVKSLGPGTAPTLTPTPAPAPAPNSSPPHAAVAEYLSMWGVADVVRAGIRGANSRGPGYTGGGSARAISIPLGVDVDGARSGEWNTFLS